MSPTTLEKKIRWKKKKKKIRKKKKKKKKKKKIKKKKKKKKFWVEINRTNKKLEILKIGK